MAMTVKPPPRRTRKAGAVRSGGAARRSGVRSVGVEPDELNLFAEAPEAAAFVPDGLTLEDVVSGVWEGLSGHAAAECVVCGGEMVPRYGAGPAVVGGRCGSCGSTLE